MDIQASSSKHGLPAVWWMKVRAREGLRGVVLVGGLAFHSARLMMRTAEQEAGKKKQRALIALKFAPKKVVYGETITIKNSVI